MPIIPIYERKENIIPGAANALMPTNTPEDVRAMQNLAATGMNVGNQITQAAQNMRERKNADDLMRLKIKHLAQIREMSIKQKTELAKGGNPYGADQEWDFAVSKLTEESLKDIDPDIADKADLEIQQINLQYKEHAAMAQAEAQIKYDNSTKSMIITSAIEEGATFGDSGILVEKTYNKMLQDLSVYYPNKEIPAEVKNKATVAYASGVIQATIASGQVEYAKAYLKRWSGELKGAQVYDELKSKLKKADSDELVNKTYSEIFTNNSTATGGLNYTQAQKDALDPNKYKDLAPEDRQKVFTLLAHGEIAEKENVKRISDELEVNMMKLYAKRKLTYTQIDKLSETLPVQYRANFVKEGYRYFDMQTRIDKQQSLAQRADVREEKKLASDTEFRKIVAQELNSPGSISLPQLNIAMEKGLDPNVALRFLENKNLLQTPEFRQKLADLKLLRDKNWFSLRNKETNIQRFEEAQANLFDIASQKPGIKGKELTDVYDKILEQAKPGALTDLLNKITNKPPKRIMLKQENKTIASPSNYKQKIKFKDGSLGYSLDGNNWYNKNGKAIK